MNTPIRHLVVALAFWCLPSPGMGTRQALRTVTFDVRDSAGAGVRILLHAPRCSPGQRRPLLIFSHGHRSSPDEYPQLLAAFAAANLVVLAPYHGDVAALGEKPRGWRERITDMQVAQASIDAAERVSGCAIDRDRLLVAGHSYGALVAQAMGGADTANRPTQIGPRPVAVLAFSPPGPIAGLIDATGWRSIEVPMMVVTGTADIVPRLAPDWRLHMVSYDAASGPKLLLVGRGVDHCFGGIVGCAGRGLVPQSKAFAAVTRTMRQFIAGALVRPRNWQRLAPQRVMTREGDAMAIVKWSKMS